MWFAKTQHHGPADVKEILSPIIPTAEAMVAMLNPVVQLDGKPPKAPSKKRPSTRQHSNAATMRLAQVTATHFIGPVQPPRRLALPRPASQALQDLSTALTTCATTDILLDVHNLRVEVRSLCTLLGKIHNLIY